MSLGFRSLDNLSITQANDSVNVSDIPGDSGVGPIGFVFDVFAHGIIPDNNGQSLQIFPSGAFTVGNGSADTLDTLVSFTNLGNDKDFGSIYGAFNFPNGFWASAVRAILTGGTGTLDFALNFSTSNPILDYDPNLTDTPHDLTSSDISWDGNKGTTLLSVEYDNNNSEDPTAIAFYRDDLPLASVPWESGTTTYNFTDVVFASGNYVYKAVVYKYSPNKVSPTSNEISVDFGGVPSFEIVGSGGFDLGGSAIFGFLVDPSGIYTLTPNKTNDTVYNDSSVDDTTTDFAFPDPFFKTFFAGK